MSGGALNYLYSKIQSFKEDIADFLNEEKIDEETKKKIVNFIDKTIDFFYYLEWFMSGDISKEKFLEEIRKCLK
ncbi:hypothetical protein DRN69_03910 [Candidatus Pacearchaeota archaeon]|nr:MAG: hypothetical protein DRN69_03910 [Candidatus Pacearchaeota archaeon]